MNLRILGAHNMETRTTRPVSLLVEGVLALDAGGLAASLTLKEQQSIGSILLTHRHYDHVKDVPLLALNTFDLPGAYHVHAITDTLAHLEDTLLKGGLYPRFTERPSPEHPKVRLHPVTPLVAFTAEGFQVTAVPMPHGAPAVGYQVTSTDGASLFYTGDTGGGLTQMWKHLEPAVLVVEVTLPNRYEEQALEQGHLTPHLLSQELKGVQGLGHTVPPVYAIHMNPWHEEEIHQELAIVGETLGVAITLASEDMAVMVTAAGTAEAQANKRLRRPPERA